MKHTLLYLLVAFCSTCAFAQTPGDQSEPEDETLSLFDDDMEETETGWPQLAVTMGYMALDADGTFDIVGPGGNRVRVLDLDRLGVDDKDGSLLATVKWRSRTSNWGGWFGYWSFSGAGFRYWNDSLILEDGTVIPVGAGVATELTTDWYILEATYSFVQNDNWDVGLGIGVHVVDIKTRFAIGAQIGEEQGVVTNAKLDTLAPLPNVLGYAHYRMNERWSATARYGWFALTYDEYDGQMTNLHALLRYDLSERWGLEGGYQFVKLDVDINEDYLTGLFDMNFSGPMGTLRFQF